MGVSTRKKIMVNITLGIINPRTHIVFDQKKSRIIVNLVDSKLNNSNDRVTQIIIYWYVYKNPTSNIATIAKTEFFGLNSFIKKLYK